MCLILFEHSCADLRKRIKQALRRVHASCSRMISIDVFCSRFRGVSGARLESGLVLSATAVEGSLGLIEQRLEGRLPHWQIDRERVPGELAVDLVLPLDVEVAVRNG